MLLLLLRQLKINQISVHLERTIPCGLAFCSFYFIFFLLIQRLGLVLLLLLRQLKINQISVHLERTFPCSLAFC